MKCLKALEGHTASIRSIAISPDGQTLASGSYEVSPAIRLWNPQTGKLLKILNDFYVTALAFSPDGQTLYSGSGNETAKIWDWQAGQVGQSFEGPYSDNNSEISAVALTSDGQTLFIGTQSGKAEGWDLRTQEKIVPWKLSGFSKLALSHNNSTLVGSYINVFTVWNVPQRQRKLRLETKEEPIASLALSQDGETILSGHFDGKIHFWSTQTGDLLHTLTGHTGIVRTLAIRGDGKILASGSDDHSLRLWDLSTLSEFERAEGETGEVKSATFSPDGSLLFSGSNDRTVRIWQVPSY